MSNYYDSLGQDLAPAMGMPPIDQYGQPHPDPIPPPMPPPMPPSMGGGAVGGGGGGGGMSGGVSPVLSPGPNVTQPGPPPGIPMPPPMAGGGGPGFQGDPFNQALTQAGAATQMFSPGAPGLAPRPPMPPPMAPPQQGGGGQQVSGAPMPPPMPGSQPPAGPGTGNSVPFGPSTDYATAMGIKPTDQDRGQSMLAGLGKGLSAAASSKNSAGNAFMKGAGGSITGSIQEQQEQQKVAAGLQNQYFNQTSAAFKDWNAKKSADSLEVYRQSLAAWNNAKIAAGGPGAKTFLNSPEGKLHMATQEAEQNYDRDSKNLALLKNAIPSEDYLKRYDALEGKHQQYLADAYKKYGVNPQDAQNIQTRGFDLPKKWSDIQNGQYYTDANGTPQKKTPNSTGFKPDDTVQFINPFPTKGMDTTTFNQTVPNGMWYETGGNLYRRTQPPPAAGPAMAAPAQADPTADREAYYGPSAPGMAQ